LEVIDPQGEPFDPEHHEAMMVVETDECPEDPVVEVIQKGYRFRGVLLRPAMVQVSCPVKG
ncbi:MAG: nucleotide exchange factor GrpE, partial [Patescibacteria group bacterium]